MESGRTLFNYSNPDFNIRAHPENVVFPVKKSLLAAGSGVFQDMFKLCGPEEPSETPRDSSTSELETMDLTEETELLSLLLQFLHDPPQPAPNPKDDKFGAPIQEQAAIPPPIPLPIIRSLLMLSDKYDLSPPLIMVLESHLSTHNPTDPLAVYSLATTYNFSTLADRASKYLHNPPLHTYTPTEIKQIPTAEAYHELVLLHSYRVEQLKKALKEEDMFPHRYGECSSHLEETKRLWERRRKAVLPNIEAGTDVAGEMDTVLLNVKKCEVCTKACVRAIEMLRYKCARIPKSISKIPTQDTSQINTTTTSTPSIDAT